MNNKVESALIVLLTITMNSLNKITADMEESAIKLLDSIGKYKNQKG